MANSQPMFSYSFLRLDGAPSGANVSYGTLNSSINGTSSFSISAWIRVREIQSSQQIFGTANFTLLGVQIEGDNVFLYTSIQGSNQQPVTSPDPVPVNQWTYVVMVYDASGDLGPSVNFYIGGVVSGGALVSQPSITPGAFYTTAVGVDISILALWSAALPPSQCYDIYQSPSAGAIAIYDFVNGPAQDVSGNNNPIELLSGAAQFWAANCLNFYSDGMALLPSTNVNPGSAGAAFSICGWVNVTPTSFEKSIPVYSNGSGDPSLSGFGLVISVDYSTSQSQPCTMHVKYGAASGTFYDLPGKQVFNAGDWHWFGVTFSTNGSSGTLTLYLDGQLDTSVSANIAQALPVFQGQQFFGGGSPVFFEGSIQAISIFDQALQPNDLFSCMNTDPSQSPSCVAFYSFEVSQAIEDLSGQDLTLSGAAVLLEQIAAVTGTTANSASRASSGASVRGASASADWAQKPFNLNALAAELSLNPNVRPTSSHLSNADIDQIIAGYEQLLSTCPISLRAQYRQRFRENLYRGIQLQNVHSDPRIGMISYAQSGDDYVYYHHLPGGPQEVYRLSVGAVSSKYLAWEISVVANFFNIILTVLGMAIMANVVLKAVSRSLASARIAQSQALKAALSEPFDSSKAGFWFIALLQALYNLGPELVRQFLAGTSWWSFAFAVAALILNIVAMLATGGAYLCLTLAQMGIAIAQFVLVLNDKPEDDSSSSATAAAVVPAALA
jgi:Concanavalin A-like lectin/glucanases superfamily